MPTVALLIWPVIAVAIAAAIPRPQALVVIVLVPYMFLPENFAIQLPGVPDLSKISVISFAILLAFALVQHRRTDAPASLDDRTASRLLRGALAVCVAGLMISVGLMIWGNPEPLVFTERTIPAIRTWDAISLFSDILIVLIPLFFAQRYLTTPERHVILLRGFAWGALVYSVLMLIEMRFSPQLHSWVYGFHQHTFGQHIRGSGYRPMMFLKHGLYVGFFIFTGLAAAVGLWKGGHGKYWGLAALWLALILLLSNNLGATVVAAAMLGMFLVFPRRIQLVSIVLIALVFLGYPAIRQGLTVPLQSVVEMIDRISPERAHSLQFRLGHEESLLARANEKPWTGWGIWGRNRVYSPEGRDLSVVDGYWIAIFGRGGWPYYLSLFGLLALPIVTLAGAARTRALPPETMILALILAGNLIYQIPNRLVSPLDWMIAGALIGFLLRKGAATAPDASDTVPADRDRRPRTAYSRFPPAAARHGRPRFQPRSTDP